MTVSWLDRARTGEIRRPLLAAALAHLRMSGLSFDEAGLSTLGLEDAEDILAPVGGRAIDAWVAGPNSGLLYSAVGTRLQAAVAASLAGCWWDASERFAEELRVSLVVDGDFGRGRSTAWDRYIRPKVPYAVIPISAWYDRAGWVVCAPETGFDCEYGLPVSVGGACRYVRDARMHAVLSSWREHARRRGRISAHPYPALLLSEERREAVFSSFAVGGAAAGAQTLAACLA